MKVLELLEKAFTYIDTPDKWTYGVLARGSKGEGLFVRSPDAVCFCSLGAIKRACIDNPGMFEEVELSTTKLLAEMPYSAGKTFVERVEYATPTEWAEVWVTLVNDNSSYHQVVDWWRSAIDHAKQA